MQASVMRIDEFISDRKTFVIPVYQRNYGWLKANCKQLFDDVEFIAKNGGEHFIGTFVYKREPSASTFQEFVIIDGQQRITSIILFTKALYDLTDDEDLKDSIREKFIKHHNGALKGKCKLRPTEYDRVTFEKLMRDEFFDENNFSEQEKISALYSNYRFFHEKVSASEKSLQDLHDAICRLRIVSISLENEKSQEIFESLNSTGLDLTKADLIRNFLLMQVETRVQEELYKNYWLEIENLLRPSDNVENFLEQYLIVKLKSRDAYSTKVNSSSLYTIFKRYFNDRHLTTEICFKDMLRYAKFFRKVIFDDDTNFERLPSLDKKFYELTFLLKATNAPIILMYLLDRYEKNNFSEAIFINFIDALISLTLRAKICGNSGITSQFAGNMLARLDKEDILNEKIFWRVVTFGKGRYTFPNNKTFQENLEQGQLYKTRESNFCKYVLYSLERAARSKELPSYSKATIEHILPQNPNDTWKKYLKERNDSQTHELWLHTLGNLTLTEENGTLGNSDFDNKKKIYLRSNYSYTKALIEYSEWTSKQIQKRAKKLSEAAIKIWTLPEEFNSSTSNIGETLNLDSDFGALTGTKPASVLIFDKEIKISNWSDLVREVVKQLYALDKDIFRRAAQMENILRRNNLFSTTANHFRYEFKLDENYYMAAGLGTDICLRIVKALVENFDRLSGTNFREEIYFTLRR